MRLGMTGGALLLAALAGACAVVGPLYDRRMGEAPLAACAAVNVAVAAQPGTPAGNVLQAGGGIGPVSMKQCFTLAEEMPGGGRRAWQGGAIGQGQTLIAIYRREPGCFGAPDRPAPPIFSHATVTGSSPGAGEAELSVWDLHGRPGHARTLRWSGPFEDRTFVLASAGSVTASPDGIRIRVTQGRLDPANLCFKSY